MPDTALPGWETKHLLFFMRHRDCGIDADDVETVLHAWGSAGILTEAFVQEKCGEYQRLPPRLRRGGASRFHFPVF